MSFPDGGNASSSQDQNSSWDKNSSTFPPIRGKNKVEEISDEDQFTVPDVEDQPASESKKETQQSTCGTGVAGKRRRGRNPGDKEYRRLKRLLRNRVSAQQARERKKVYVSDLESKAEQLQDKNSKLEEKISTLINENTMLRKVLMSTRPKDDESIEPKHDQSSKS